jgi:2-dehydropantoate 2-reductase
LAEEAMENLRIAVVGIGATGAVLAAALLNKIPETILVDPRPGLKEEIEKSGIRVSGEVTYHVPVLHFLDQIEKMKKLSPNFIFVSTKTFHLPEVLDGLKGVFAPGTKIVSTHNGLGTEDLIAEAFGVDSAFRMSLNFGVSLKGPGGADVAFFNRPNHLGSLTRKNQELGLRVAELLTESGLDTEFVDDIKYYVWKKMVIKCTMASLCAVTDKTLKGAIDFPATREIAEACFHEALSVARAQGYDLGEGYVKEVLGYLEKVGPHKDSMCFDLANKTPTEIDFLGGKVVEYAKQSGIPVPFYTAMTNLVKALEDDYLKR